MDLSQTKLTKTEWITTEIPVADDEKFILKMIIDGYHNINIRTNKNQSLFQRMKIEYTPENETFLYKKYFHKNNMTVCMIGKELPIKSIIQKMCEKI